jgi:hypothetical protein
MQTCGSACLPLSNSMRAMLILNLLIDSSAPATTKHVVALPHLDGMSK